MIASMLTLSRKDCQQLKISDVYSLHRVVYSLFPLESETERDFLFADKGGDFFNRRILILSKRKPQNSEYGKLEIKEIDDAFLKQGYYGFEVLVNPVKRDSKSRKVIPVRGRSNLLEWFTKKSEQWGFSILSESLTVQDTDVVQFKREKNGKKENITFGKARFIGKLKVIDRKVFIDAFQNGLGKGKAFGFGLLQIVPLSDVV